MTTAWQLAAELVRIDSSNPGAREHIIAERIAHIFSQRTKRLPQALARHVRIDQLEVLDGRRDIMISIDARARGEDGADHAPALGGERESTCDNGARDAQRHPGPEGRLVFICHMDTVTLGEGWDRQTPALGATVRDNRLYGRGACDMKGGLACAISAFLALIDRME